MLLVMTIILLAVLVFVIKVPLSAFAICTNDEIIKRATQGVLLIIIMLLLGVCFFAFLRGL